MARDTRQAGGETTHEELMAAVLGSLGASIDGLVAQRDELAKALRLTRDAMRALRRLAFTGSRIPPERYPEKALADEADKAACIALGKPGVSDAP